MLCGVRMSGLCWQMSISGIQLNDVVAPSWQPSARKILQEWVPNYCSSHQVHLQSSRIYAVEEEFLVSNAYHPITVIWMVSLVIIFLHIQIGFNFHGDLFKKHLQRTKQSSISNLSCTDIRIPLRHPKVARYLRFHT